MHTVSGTDLKTFLRCYEQKHKASSLIRKNCMSPHGLMAEIHRLFWEWNNSDRPAGHHDHSAKLKEWQDKFLRVRLVHAFGPAGCAVVGGYVVAEGNLMALHSTSKGLGLWLLRHAMQDGAVFLNTFADNPLRRHLPGEGWVLVQQDKNHAGPEHPDVLFFTNVVPNEHPNW